MNRVIYGEVCDGIPVPIIIDDGGSMKFSKEYICAQKIEELLSVRDNDKRSFLVICELHGILCENNLNGIEVYLYLENLLDRKVVYAGDELISIIDRMFFEFSWKRVDDIFRSCRQSRYDAWRTVSDTIYCIQPVFYHYVNEKEFMGKWNSKSREWIEIKKAAKLWPED